MSREFDDSWVSEDYIKQIKTESELMRIPHRQQFENILNENLPLVAHQLVHLMNNHPDVNIRIKAMDRIMDRTLGKPRVSQEINVSASPQESLHDKMMAEIAQMLERS